MNNNTDNQIKVSYDIKDILNEINSKIDKIGDKLDSYHFRVL